MLQRIRHTVYVKTAHDCTTVFTKSELLRNAPSLIQNCLQKPSSKNMSVRGISCIRIIREKSELLSYSCPWDQVHSCLRGRWVPPELTPPFLLCHLWLRPVWIIIDHHNIERRQRETMDCMLDSSLFTELGLGLMIQRTQTESDDLKASDWAVWFKGLWQRLAVQRTRTYGRLMIQRPQAESDDSKASDWGWWIKEPGPRLMIQRTGWSDAGEWSTQT